MHSPPPVESDPMACSFEVQQEDRPLDSSRAICLKTLWAFQKSTLPLNSAGLSGQPQTRQLG